MVGQSQDSFALLSNKDVVLFQHCQQAIQVLNTEQLYLSIKWQFICAKFGGNALLVKGIVKKVRDQLVI
jgi:hypothetical protein